MDELSLARIDYATDVFGCGVLFGMLLLAYCGSVVCMFAGLGLLALFLALIMAVLAGCVVGRFQEAMRALARLRDLKSEYPFRD